MRLFRILAVLMCVTTLEACQVKETPPAGLEPPRPVEGENETLAPVDVGVAGELSWAAILTNGNHLLEGSSPLDQSVPLEIQLDFTPVWLVGIETGQGSGWVAASAEGDVQSFELIGREIVPVITAGVKLFPGSPPVLSYNGDRLSLLATHDPRHSPESYPVILARSGRVAFVAGDGSLVVRGAGSESRLVLGALPDARLLVDEQDRILLLGNQTERYAHGVLGDSLEAGAIMLVQTHPELELIRTIEVESHEVIEGLSPIWVDVDGDGVREIIVTISDGQLGAYLALFSDDGRLLARSNAIGQAYRWRHQITAADFLGTGKIELASVLTPHIGGVLEYYHLEGDRWVLVSELRGVSTHQIGSRNMEMALSADVDGDRRLEIIVPGVAFDTLFAVQRDIDAVRVDWEIPLSARLTTNIAGITFKDGSIAMAVGLENGLVLVWLP